MTRKINSSARFYLQPFNGGPNGLPATVSLIDTIYNDVYPSIMSRADFWALCAIVATEEAVKHNNEVYCAGTEHYDEDGYVKNNTYLKLCLTMFRMYRGMGEL